MREDGTTEDSSSSSFMVIGGSGGVGGDGGSGDDDCGRQHFVRSLESKLKKLQRRATGNKRSSSRKPVFVTTVKTGIFLDPPPDLAALLGLDDRSSSSVAAGDVDSNSRYYSYSSKPRVLYDKQHQRTTAATTTVVTRKYEHQHDTCKQPGYTNIMHDKRVIRGSNFSKKSYRPKWNPYFGYAKQLSSEPNFQKESTASRETEARRRAMARKKAMDYQTRALRLNLGAPKLTKGRQNVDIQTDMHLEELYEYPESQTFGVQTDFDQEMSYNLETGTLGGINASTQVDDKDLFNFEIEVTPIAESLIADVFRQAMREVLYEDELDAKARQQRALYLQYTIQKIEKEKLEYEDERLKKVQAGHFQFYKNNETTKDDRHTSTESTNLIENTNNPTINTTAKSTPTGVESPEFVAWLKEELQVESDELLKDIVRDIVQRRLDIHKEVTEVQNIRKPEELFREIESVTLQSDPTNINEADNQHQIADS